MANKRVSLKGKGADLFFGDYKPPESDTEQASDSQEPIQVSAPESAQPAIKSTTPPTSRSASRSTGRSTVQSTNRSRSQQTRPSKIVDRPKAFYITERLDTQLDDAVRYFQQVHGIRKVDRSVVINAILDNEAQWSEESLDSLVDRVISQLTSRLTGR